MYKTSILKLAILVALLFLIKTNTQAQKKAYQKQTFNIKNIAVQQNYYEGSKKVLLVTFDCKFGRVIEDVTHARYKFDVVLKGQDGKVIYQDPRNKVAALATESQHDPNISFAEKLQVKIPYRKIQLVSDTNQVTVQINARSHEFDDPTFFEKIATKKTVLTTNQKSKVPFDQQEFEVADFKMQNDKKQKVRGAKFKFDLKAKYAHDQISNPKNIVNSGIYYLYIKLKTDSLGKVVYSPPAKSNSFVHHRIAVKPHPNRFRGGQILEEVEFFVPYEKINMPSGPVNPWVEIVATDFDSTTVIPLYAHNVLINKPEVKAFEDQKLTFHKVHPTDQIEMNGLNGFKVDFDFDLAFGGIDIAGSETTPDLATYCLSVTLIDDKETVVYQAPSKPSIFKTSKVHYAFVPTDKYQLEGLKTTLFVPYKDIDLPNGEHTLTAIISATDPSGEQHIPKISTFQLKINQPNTYFAKIQTKDLVLKPTKQWTKTPVKDALIKRRGDKAPHAFWRVMVGNQTVFQSKTAHQLKLIDDTYIFRVSQKDKVNFAVFDDAFKSSKDAIGKISMGGKGQGKVNNKASKNSFSSGQINLTNMHIPEIRRNEISLSNNEVFDGVHGTKVTLAYRITRFPENGKLLIVPKIYRKGRLIPVRYLWVIDGEAEVTAKKALEVEKTVQTLSWLIPQYALQEGDELYSSFEYEGFDLSFGTTKVLGKVELPEQLKDILIKEPKIATEFFEGMKCARIDIDYEIPNKYFEDLKSRIQFDYQLIEGGQSLAKHMRSNTHNITKDRLMPRVPKGTWSMYIPFYELAQYKPLDQFQPVLSITPKDLQHAPQDFNLKMPAEKLKNITWNVLEYERETAKRNKGNYRYCYWSLKVGDKVVHISDRQEIKSGHTWKADTFVLKGVHPEDMIELSLWDSSGKGKHQTRRVATWRGDLKQLKSNQIKLKNDKLKKGLVKVSIK